MKAEELRIGNYVQHDGMPIIVQNLVKDDFWHIRNGDNYCVIALEDLKPIPLTPELLEKCGFNRARRVEGFTLHGIDLVVTSGGSIFANRTGVEIKFLHQLQNYIFALAGKELEVKYKSTIRK